MPVIGKYLPTPSGFGTHTFLMMVGVYLAARLCRIYRIDERIGIKTLVAIIAISGALCAVGFSHYDSPVSFVFMASMFFVFKRMQFGVVGRLAVLLSPSMLSVYLIHWSLLGIFILNQMEAGGGEFGRALLTAATLFCMSIILDVPRRLLFTLVASLSQIQSKYTLKRAA